MPGLTVSIPVAVDVPFVGRARERAVLAQSIMDAKNGKGSTWLVEGPAGIGKTRLTRWIQETAEAGGFRTVWGYALKEVNTAFFPFQQIFRALPSITEPDQGSESLPSPLPGVVIFEEAHPDMVLDQACRLSANHPPLLITRERPSSLRKRLTSLSPATKVLWLSRGEGEEHLTPTDVDGIGEELRSHLEKVAGSVVVLVGVEYLASQNGFSPVLKLIQFLRDVVEEREGHLLLSLNPDAFEKRDLSLLEGEGHVVKPRPDASPEPVTPESPLSVMLRYLDTLEHESPKQPIVIVVDDLQWADPDSLRTFQFLARNIRKLPVGLLTTLRTDDVRTPEELREQGLTEILGAMEREGTLHRLVLGGLTLEDSEGMIRGMMGLPLQKGAEDQALQRLLERTGGNAFFLQETFRELATEGRIQREGNTLVLSLGGEEGSGGVRIPESIRRLVAIRLDRLGTEKRKVLEWAAVAGSEFDATPLEDLLKGTGVSIQQTLKVLERQERLIERRPGASKAERWAFMHPLVWEVTLSELANADKRKMAKCTADWWSRNRPKDTETVARLYHDGMDGGEGISWVRKAIEMAVRAHFPENVERYHRWLQELLEAGGVDVATRVRTGLAVIDDVRENIGGAKEAVSILRMLESLGPEGELRWEVEARLLMNLRLISPSDARERLGKLREEMKGAGMVGAYLQSQVGLAEISVAIIDDRNADIVKETSHMLTLGEGIPRLIRITALYYCGTALALMGKVKEAKERLAQLRTLVGPTDNAHILGYATSIEVYIAKANGMVANDRMACEENVTLFRASGSAVNIAIGLANLIETHALYGDMEGARRTLQDLEKHCSKFGVEIGAIVVPLGKGMVTLRERKWEEARQDFERTLGEMISRGDMENLKDAQIGLTEAYLGAGLPAQARQSLSLVRSGGELPSHLIPRLTMAEGWLWFLEKHPREAKDCFEKAVTEAHSAGNVFNEGLAKNYLGRWEESYGDLEKSKVLHGEANTLFDTSGVLPDGWAREWPPAFTVRAPPPP